MSLAHKIVDILLESADGQTMPLDELLRRTKPVDDPDWKAAFGYIERNHHDNSPDYWKRFLSSVKRHGIRTPIEIEQRRGQLIVTNGAHRVWAAWRLGLTKVPIKLKA